MAELKLQDNPNTCPGCYSLDMYCQYKNESHGFEEFPHIYMGETFSECANQAKVAGWKLNRKTMFATCPKCVQELKKKPR